MKKYILLFVVCVVAHLQNVQADTYKVGTTTTGAPGTPAKVAIKKTGKTVKFNFTIPQGLPGTNGTNASNISSQQLAILKWGPRTINNSNLVGLAPYAACIDGTNLWTANFSSGSISKVDIKTNSVSGYLGGSNPSSICFDGGADVWWTDYTANKVISSKIATGAANFVVNTGTHPYEEKWGQSTYLDRIDRW